MTEDPRMLLVVTERKVEESHCYLIKIDGAGIIFRERHAALQYYTGARRRLNDFATEPENYRVRIWCDDVEYFCDQESSPPGPRRDRGKSCRQFTGAVRPYYWERHMP